MKIRCVWLILLNVVLLFFTNCSDRNTDKLTIDFGDLKSVKSMDLISDYSYVLLETSDNSLFGSISQIEVFDDKIYILDNRKTNSLYVFTMEGKYVTSIKSKGDGPGEFISPHSFWIDRGGFIFILDRQQGRLLKYQLEDLKFVDDIVIPSPAPLSFASIPSQDLFIYYYPLRKNDMFSGKQYIVADSKGTIVSKYYTAPLSGKILHGSPTNFYLFNDHIRTYPYFDNDIYEINNDSLNCCYKFSWDTFKVPDDDFFVKYNNSGDAMKEILTGGDNWIRLLYVYEVKAVLAIKYYIKKDFYLSIWNKKENKTINIKSENVIDNLGMGGSFPLPIGICNNRFVGTINLFDITEKGTTDQRLVKLIKNMPQNSNPEDSNPILVFYHLKVPF